MPGENEYYKTELLIFDAISKDIKKITLDTIKQQSISVYREPRKKSNMDDDFQPSLLLSKKDIALSFNRPLLGKPIVIKSFIYFVS